MTNHPSKISGNISSIGGSIKETTGRIIGNKSMEADGVAKRTKGDAEVAAAKAAGYAAGTADKVSGTVKNVAGQVVGNDEMRVRGEAEKKKGETKQEINK